MSNAILLVEGVEKHFGGIKALQGVDLSLNRGELHCIIGPNGAGKSTFFNAITGMFKLTSGTIYYEGRNIAGLSIHEFARLGITRKFQVPSLFESMTIEDNLAVAMLKLSSSGSRQSRIDEMLEVIGLEKFAGEPANILSHGQKQWLEIGMAVIGNPKLLLLDEPTAGMTSDETSKTADMLLNFKGDHTVVVIEHDMKFVRQLNSHTIVMHQGKVLRNGSFEDIEQDKKVRDVYLGRQ